MTTMIAPLVGTLSLLVLSGSIWPFIRRRLCSTSSLNNIPGPPPKSLVFGSLKELWSAEGWAYHNSIAAAYGGVIKLKGLLGINTLYVFDPKALHHVLVKDQGVYEEAEFFLEGNRIALGEGIFSSVGERHRLQRKLLSPVFSVAYLRRMTPVFYEVGHKLRNTLVNKTLHGPQEIDLLAWMTRLALELIGQGGLGYSFDTLEENSVPHEYSEAAKKLSPNSTEVAALQSIVVPIVVRLGPSWFRRWLVEIIPSKFVHEAKSIVDTLHGTAVNIFESKNQALAGGDEVLAEHIGRGADIISILMRENLHTDEAEKLSDGELLGQINSLVFAATDTTSGALSRIFHLLAMNKDVQQRLREEIRNAKMENGGQDLSYDTLVSLPYLDAICRETLRLHPPVSMVQRTAQQDVMLPLSTPIKGRDGQDIREILVPRGTEIFVGIYASNRNPEVWGTDAHEWKPGRWLGSLPDSVTNARIPGVYSHLLTFIGGGRSCIGFKFSQLEMKVALVLLLEHLEFTLSDTKINWQMTAIVTPNIAPHSPVPTMPIVISRAAR